MIGSPCRGSHQGVFQFLETIEKELFYGDKRKDIPLR